jgi:hypothetical protein
MENKNIIIYSVFSGTIYEMPEKDFNLLDISHIPLKEYPTLNKNKNFGRPYTGRDLNNFAYYAAPSVIKVIDRSKNSNDTENQKTV